MNIPSITGVILLCDWLLRGRLFARPERRVVAMASMTLGIALFITTLGRPALNLYGTGFSAGAIIVVALIGVIVAGRLPRVGLLALIVLVAFDLHLQTMNVYDYITDPVTTLVLLASRLRFASAKNRGIEEPT